MKIIIVFLFLLTIPLIVAEETKIDDTKIDDTKIDDTITDDTLTDDTLTDDTLTDDTKTEEIVIDYWAIPDDELVQLAETGDREAQYYLGVLISELENSHNITRLGYVDRNKYHWFELAAAQNHGKSLTIIGKEYLTAFGYYRNQDYIKAEEHFTAGMSEDPESLLLISILTYYGLGAVSDKLLAEKYLIESQHTYYRIPPMIHLQKELVQMIRELTRKDIPEALFILGDFYYTGKTDFYLKDYKKAFRIFNKAGELGNSSAAFMLGTMLYDGIGVLKDLKQSYKWITLSAQSGNLQAIIKAGIMNYFGDGTTIDLEKAFNWFKISAKENDSLSQYFLGVMYFKAEGVEQDLSQTKYWIQKAFENGSATAKRFWDKNKLWSIP
ncbi:MAG: sel1 repeat family protein [Spirochaetaceae bacterium]